MERVATLHEIETYWNICDVADANDALDALNEAKHEAGTKG
jgi:hypothetical protein